MPRKAQPKKQSTSTRGGRSRGGGRASGRVEIGADGLPIPVLARPGPVRASGLRKKTNPTEPSAASLRRAVIDEKKRTLIQLMRANTFLFDRCAAGHFDTDLKHEKWAEFTQTLNETDSKCIYII